MTNRRVPKFPGSQLRAVPPNTSEAACSQTMRLAFVGRSRLSSEPKALNTKNHNELSRHAVIMSLHRIREDFVKKQHLGPNWDIPETFGDVITLAGKLRCRLMGFQHIRRKMKHLDWYMTMKKTSDKRNAKYYATWRCVPLEGAVVTPGRSLLLKSLVPLMKLRCRGSSRTEHIPGARERLATRACGDLFLST